MEESQTDKESQADNKNHTDNDSYTDNNNYTDNNSQRPHAKVDDQKTDATTSGCKRSSPFKPIS